MATGSNTRLKRVDKNVTMTENEFNSFKGIKLRTVKITKSEANRIKQQIARTYGENTILLNGLMKKKVGFTFRSCTAAEMWEAYPNLHDEPVYVDFFTKEAETYFMLLQD